MDGTGIPSAAALADEPAKVTDEALIAVAISVIDRMGYVPDTHSDLPCENYRDACIEFHAAVCEALIAAGGPSTPAEAWPFSQRMLRLSGPLKCEDLRCQAAMAIEDAMSSILCDGEINTWADFDAHCRWRMVQGKDSELEIDDIQKILDAAIRIRASSTGEVPAGWNLLPVTGGLLAAALHHRGEYKDEMERTYDASVCEGFDSRVEDDFDRGVQTLDAMTRPLLRIPGAALVDAQCKLEIACEYLSIDHYNPDERNLGEIALASALDDITDFVSGEWNDPKIVTQRWRQAIASEAAPKVEAA